MRKWGWYTALLLLVVVLVGLYMATQVEKVEIVAIGDSLTHGQGDPEEGFVTILERKLNRDSQDKVYHFNNLGVPGQPAEGVMEQLSTPEVSSMVGEADYMTLYIGTNDILQANDDNFLPIDEEGLNKELKRYRQDLIRIVESIREKNADVHIAFIGIYDPNPQVGNVNPYVVKWNEVIQEVQTEFNNTSFISTDDLFKDKPKEEYFSDGLHLNHKGYELLAKRIAEESNL